MNEELVVIDTVAGRIEAELLHSYLHAKGIECLLSQEAAGGVYGINVGHMARVEILIRASQQREARRIIDDYHAAQAANDLGASLP